MVWWRRAVVAGEAPPQQPVEEFPDLLPHDSRAARAAVAGRVDAFTPEWKVGRTGDDAGVALVKAFGEQVAPVAERTNRLREKYARELLRIAGLRGAGARAGVVLVVITLVETARASVIVPARTQLTAPAADGDGQVIFETVRDVVATPSRLAALVVQAGTRATHLDPSELTPEAGVLAFGRRPQPGHALWLGLEGPPPAPRLALALELADDASRPLVATSGGVGSAVASGEPTVQWEVLTGDGLVPVAVQLDGTDGLRRSGIVEIETAADWPAVAHPGLGGLAGSSRLRWFRVVFQFGRYDLPPRLAAVRLNAVMAEGVETVRDEVLDEIEDVAQSGPGRRFQLSRTPVMRGTVQLAIDAPDPADLFDVEARPATSPAWTEVSTLARSRPYDQHFVVDDATGVVTFGDGVRGAAVPAGFRHVRATSYRTGGGAATEVPAEAGFVPRQTIPSLEAIENPYPATGAADGEPVPELMARGAALLTARGRAVRTADVEVLAAGASAEVGRVIALAGVDVDGTPRPGQMTLIVVGSRRGDGRPPAPTEAALTAVVDFLAPGVAGSAPVAPLGAQVVVRPARFAPVQLDIALRPADDVDRARLFHDVSDAVNEHLDPLTGGPERIGWPAGTAISWRRLLAVVSEIDGVASVSRLAIVVAGNPTGPCQDAPLPRCALPWPTNHLIVAAAGGGRSLS